MTLGEHPEKVDPRFLIRLDHFLKSEFDIGKFRDIGHQAGVNRFNMAGGAVMEDFDNDGRLDLAVTTFDPDRAHGLLPQHGRRHLRGPHRGGRADRTARRQVPRPDRLQQRRPDGPVHLAGRLVPAADAAVPAAERRRRQVHRRHQGGGAELRPSTPRRRAGPTTTTTAGSTSSSSASGQPTACITTGATGPSRTSPPRPACGRTDAALLQGGRLDRLRQRRLSGPVRRTTCRATPGCITTIATARSPTSPRRWASTAPRGASRAGPGTTTTTAGSTSSPPATTTRSATSSRG